MNGSSPYSSNTKKIGKKKKGKMEYSALGAKVKRVRRKGSQKSKLSYPDDSETCRAVVEGSKKNVPCTGGTDGQMGVKVTSKRPEKACARDSDSRFGGGKAYCKSPFMGAQGPRSGNGTISREPIKSWVKGNKGNRFDSFEQWDLGDDTKT